MIRWIGLVCLLAWSACAHEVRPAYLVLHEEEQDEFTVHWKVPLRQGAQPELTPTFSGQITPTTATTTNLSLAAALEISQIHVEEPLRGQSIRILGLESGIMDTLVRIEFLDGSTWVQRLTDAEPAATIPEKQRGWGVAAVYGVLGVEHILLGIDHLLFVLALLIITKGSLTLVKTVTAFTLAHSITLVLATLGLIHIPSAPVEAVISLSIVFVAMEILRARKGWVGLTARSPWIVAFTFGLLHGFGFAGALSEVGLPEGHVPLALLFFNLGVEIGQLLFIGVVLWVMQALNRAIAGLPRWTELVPPYAIGSLAMYWVIERMLTF